MYSADAVEFGHAFKSKLEKSNEQDVTKFANLVMQRVIWSPPLSNAPSGSATAPRITMHGSADKSSAADLIDGGGAVGGAAIIVYIVGEDHKSIGDAGRARSMVSRLNSQPDPTNCLLIEERGMKHLQAVIVKPNFLYANESDISGALFTVPQRSVGIAAYAALCAGGGDQSKQSKILIPIGDNHVDQVQTAFEHISLNSDALPSLRLRPRIYHILRFQP